MIWYDTIAVSHTGKQIIMNVEAQVRAGDDILLETMTIIEKFRCASTPSVHQPRGL